MAKWAVIQSADLLFVGAVFTRSTHPELIVHQRTAAHNTSWKLCATIGTNLTPAEMKGQFKRYDAISYWSFPRDVMAAMFADQNNPWRIEFHCYANDYMTRSLRHCVYVYI